MADHPLSDHPDQNSLKAMGMTAPPEEWYPEQRKAVGIEEPEEKPKRQRKTRSDKGRKRS